MLTNYEIENVFNKKFDELNKILVSNYKYYNLNRILDCTVHIEVEKSKYVIIFFCY